MEIDLSECEEIEANDISLFEICDLIENLTCFENVDRENIEDWLNFDSNDPSFQIMSDADIVSNVTKIYSYSKDLHLNCHLKKFV